MDRTEHRTLAKTPWGRAQTATAFAPGIVYYSTASHGGFFVSPCRRDQMPEPYKSHRPFCGQPGWYEEDCDWSAVVLSFPDYFTQREIESARSMWAWMKEREAASRAATVGN